MNYILSLIETYQLTPVINGAIFAIFTGVICNYLLYKRAVILINKEAEKIKFEMQRNYLHLQIRTKNLYEIYPKLYQLLREAGSLYIIFETINRKIIEKQANDTLITAEDLRNLIRMCLERIDDADNFLGLNNIASFHNYHEESALFISSEVDKYANEAREHQMDLYRLVKNEIYTDQYSSYSYEQLMNIINRASFIMPQLKECKKAMSKQMNKELDPREML